MLAGKDGAQGYGLHHPPLCCRKAHGEGSNSRLTLQSTFVVRGPNTSGKKQSVVILGKEVAWYWPNPGRNSQPP